MTKRYEIKYFKLDSSYTQTMWCVESELDTTLRSLLSDDNYIDAIKYKYDEEGTKFGLSIHSEYVDDILMKMGSYWKNRNDFNRCIHGKISDGFMTYDDVVNDYYDSYQGMYLNDIKKLSGENDFNLFRF